jgi:hypothetical protein
MMLDPHMSKARQLGIQFRHFPDQPAFECDTISAAKVVRQDDGLYRFYGDLARL